MIGPSRREVLAISAAGAASLALRRASGAAPVARSAMGVTIASYSIRYGAARPAAEGFPAWAGPLDVLEHVASLGAAGLQVGGRGWQEEFAKKVRDRREALGLYLEGQIGVPSGDADVGRFEAEVRAAKEAGATVLRAAIGNRRYEDFDSAEQYRRFTAAARRSLELAEPVARRNGVKVAVENHKDVRVPELLDLLRHVSGEHVGVTLDTGNSISLLEEPMAVVEALAPHALTLHFKDMAVQEYGDGFLLAEVPLGEGLFDLSKVIETCRRGNPAVKFNLEMITRDPLRVPCLTDKYWKTLGDVRGPELARALALVRQKAPPGPLPRVSALPLRDLLEVEERNVRKCFDFARAKLGL